MASAPLPPFESDRIKALRSYDLLDTDREQGFDQIVELASMVFNKPISLMSLVDEDRQWFKAAFGLQACETSREASFCSHAILSPGVMVIPDARADDRFADNPLVTGPPHIRFYAGAPLIDQAGHALGTLCVIDSEPGEMSDEQVKMLELLAGQLSDQIRLREYERVASHQIKQAAAQNGLLQDQVREHSQAIAKTQEQVIRCLARAAECRDDDTGHHIRRVSLYVRVIARQLGLDPETCNTMAMGSMLHDIGKIGVPDRVLLKNGKLTDAEFDLIKPHAQVGADIIQSMLLDGGIWQMPGRRLPQAGENAEAVDLAVMKMAQTIALTHHEKFDGTGYPQGLKSEDIPLAGRITAVADVFDALSSNRPYKQVLSLPECLEILEDGRGKHFDPAVLDAFCSCLQEIVVIREQWQDPPAAQPDQDAPDRAETTCGAEDLHEAA